jgi:GTPase
MGIWPFGYKWDVKIMFVDRVKVQVKAGDGGNGVVSFRREAFIPRGGPDGGNGGNGGSVYFVAEPQMHTLLDFHYVHLYAAERGEHGSGARCTGKSGNDLTVKVPVGTRIYDGQELLADLNQAGQHALIAKGGRGGLGNSEFASPTNRAPRKATPGKPGDEKSLLLELMLMADVGLVGLPNAGKSTLLSVLTSARPKIAPYPFTTLHPNLGIVRPSEFTSFVLADIPGLIEGASEGKGLGFDFLRHVERTRVLVYLVDASSENPREDLKIIKAELKKWNPDLIKRPSLVVLSKGDLAPEGFKPKGTLKRMISAANGNGLEALVQEIWNLLQSAPVPQSFRAPEDKPSRRALKRMAQSQEDDEFES